MTELYELFGHHVSGGTAGINSAEFYICLECGACVMESSRSGDLARATHLEWHINGEAVPAPAPEHSA